MKRFLGDTDMGDIVVCPQCESKVQNPDKWIEEPNGTCDLCLFNEQPTKCVLCHEETHHFVPFRNVPQFGGTFPNVAWGRFLGSLTISVCGHCYNEFRLAPVYASTDQVVFSNATEWVYPGLDLSQQPISEILRSRDLTGF